MELKNTIFAILAIFCVVLSAGAVSAADNTNSDFFDDIFDGTERDFNETSMPGPGEIFPDDENVTDDGEDVDGNDTHDSMILPPDYAHDEAAAMNATGHAAGENVTGNSNALHTMPITGNPILVLLAVCVVLGGACVLRRK